MQWKYEHIFVSNYIDDFSNAQANKSVNEQALRLDVVYDPVQNVLPCGGMGRVAVGMIANASRPMTACPYHNFAHFSFLSTS